MLHSRLLTCIFSTFHYNNIYVTFEVTGTRMTFCDSTRHQSLNSFECILFETNQLMEFLLQDFNILEMSHQTANHNYQPYVSTSARLNILLPPISSIFTLFPSASPGTSISYTDSQDEFGSSYTKML